MACPPLPFRPTDRHDTKRNGGTSVRRSDCSGCGATLAAESQSSAFLTRFPGVTTPRTEALHDPVRRELHDAALGTRRTLCPRQRRALGERLWEFHHRALPGALEAHLLVDGGHASFSHWPARTRQTNASLSVAVSSASLGATSAAHTNSIA